jgi:stage V sporulation protein B
MAGETRRVSKGFLYQAAAKASFVVAGYAVHLGLGRYLGPAAYGTISIILSVTGILRIFVMDGVRQAVSRFTAVNDAALSSAIRRKALLAQATFVTGVTLIYLVLLGPLSRWLGDTTLIPYLRLASLFIPLAGFYVVYISSLNGLREFGRQAAIMILYNVVRVVGTLGLVLLGFHIYGAVVGLLLAPLVALMAGWLICRSMEAKQSRQQRSALAFDSPQTTDLMRFGLPMLFYAIGSSMLLNLDLFFVKRILPSETAPGIYSAGMALSQSLYYMAQVFVEILFPSVGALSSRSSKEETAAHIRRWLRLVILVLFLGAMLLSSSAGEVITLTYSRNYVEVTKPLAWLSWGMCFYALFIILTNIIAALGKPWGATILAIGPVPLSVLLNITLIPRFGLVGAAMATTGTALVSTVVALLWLSTLVGRPLDVLTLVRTAMAVLFSGGVSVLCGPYINVFGRWILSVLVYIFTLVVLREITHSDWASLRRLVFAHRPGST